MFTYTYNVYIHADMLYITYYVTHIMLHTARLPASTPRTCCRLRKRQLYKYCSEVIIPPHVIAANLWKVPSVQDVITCYSGSEHIKVNGPPWHCPGLLLGTEAAIETPSGIDCSVLLFFCPCIALLCSNTLAGLTTPDPCNNASSFVAVSSLHPSFIACALCVRCRLRRSQTKGTSNKRWAHR